MIEFTQIPNKLKYPPKIRGQLSTAHSTLVSYVADHYQGTYLFRSAAIGVLNTLSYMFTNSDTLPVGWEESPLDKIAVVDSDILKPILGDLFISDREVVWDLEPVAVINNASLVPAARPVQAKLSQTAKHVSKETSKEDLYIKSPIVPQFDYQHPWQERMVGGSMYRIYPSLPIIPTCQSEISVTTDVTKMSDTELLNLYPNRRIQTRAATMYSPIQGLEFDEVLGILLPIEGFTSKQVRENILKYPHLFKLSKIVDGQIVSFYTTVEIDGVLHKTLDVWDQLVDAKKMPKNADFIKEYVVRRYLLERDAGIHHNYPMFGTLDPFLTLFTTPEEYESLGYSDSIELAKTCVKSRVSYKQSRNPIIRRWNSV